MGVCQTDICMNEKRGDLLLLNCNACLPCIGMTSIGVCQCVSGGYLLLDRTKGGHLHGCYAHGFISSKNLQLVPGNNLYRYQ